VRNGGAARMDLLLHARSPDAFVRSQLEQDATGSLQNARARARTPAQEAAVAQAEAQVRRYFQVADASNPDHARIEQQLQFALTAVGELAGQSIAEADDAERRSAILDSIGSWVGYLGGALLIATVAATLIWTWREVIRPVDALERTMDAFVGGDAAARAPEAGARELHAVATLFNRVAADALRRREGRVAYLSGVAHEFREPLAALQLSMAALQVRGTLPPESELRHLLAVMNRQLTRLNRMVGDFIETIRIHGGRLVLMSEVEDLRSIAGASVEHFRTSERAPPLTAKLLDVPAMVQCDVVRIEECINSLLSHAARRTTSGHALRLVLEATNEYAQVTVEDEGTPLSTEELDRIWDELRPGDPFPESAAGAGLPLSTVRLIVSAHGGHVFATSEMGQRSVLGFVLPLLMRRGVAPRAPLDAGHGSSGQPH